MAVVLLRILSRRLRTLLADEADYEAGFALGRHILRYWPRHLDTYCALAMGAAATGLYPDAADLYRRALSAHPEDAGLWTGLQQVLAALGNDASAERASCCAFDLNPEHGSARSTSLSQATLAARRGAWDEALNLYCMGYQAAPERVDAALGLATALVHLERHAACLTVCDAVLIQLPYSLKAHLLAALSASKLGDENTAATHARVADSIDPDGEYASAWFAGPSMASRATLPAWNETERWAFVPSPAGAYASQQITAG